MSKFISKYLSEAEWGEGKTLPNNRKPHVALTANDGKIHYIKKSLLAKIIDEDYNTLKLEDNSCIFWETHITLNKKLEEVSSVTELSPVLIENIFEIDKKTIVKTTNIVTGEKTEERRPDPWYHTAVMDPGVIIFSLEDALLKYETSEITRTTGDKVTLRRPLGPGFDNPLYIIGQLDSPLFVAVDSITGDVFKLD